MPKKNIVKEISDRIVEKTAERMLEAEGIEVSRETAEKLHEEARSERPDPQAFDIFSWCEKEYAEKGDLIVYTIKKNGGFIGQKEHPYSWAEIQQDLGAGVYMVMARSTNLGRIVKTQSQRVATADNQGILSTINKPAPAAAESFQFSPEPPAPAAPQGPSITEIMALMQTQQEAARQQARESREQTMMMISEIGKSIAPILAAVLTPRHSGGGGGGAEPQGFEMMKMMFDMIRENQRMASEQMRIMLDEMKRSQPQMAAPSNPYELLEKMRRDEEGLLERAIKLQDILNDKAAEIAETRAANGGGEEKEEDTVKLILKALIPMAGAIGQQLVLNKTQAPAVEAAPAAQAVVPVARPVAPKPAAPQAPSQPVMRPVESKPRPASVIQITKPAATVTPPSAQAQPAAPAPQPSNPSVQKEDHAVKETIVRILVPYLQPVLMKMAMGNITPPKVAAEESLKLLEGKGISREAALKNFTRDDLFVVVKTYKLPETVYPWFNEYYAHFGNQTSVETR